MSGSSDQPGTTVSDPDAIREEIERTREDLAGTVDALHAKLDVKGRARERVSEVGREARSLVSGAGSDARAQARRATGAVTTDGGTPKPELLVGVVSFVVAYVALEWWRHR